ncbi:winged helix-turn-helix transcriptional regulator [Arthrobacter sp. NPDC093139]|uniref:winged helix-turn-helix transcriptional regulator n=1 Tax=Arthrobacter sp. NPDC093139 TaxID=3363945 RepID=UPI003803B85C
MSQKSLTATLRLLERNGIIERKLLSSRPVAIEYRITPLGKTLRHPHRRAPGMGCGTHARHRTGARHLRPPGPGRRHLTTERPDRRLRNVQSSPCPGTRLINSQMDGSSRGAARPSNDALLLLCGTTTCTALRSIVK